MIQLSESTSIFYKRINITLNHLTTFSLIFGIFSAVFLLKGHTYIASLCFLISYYFDCVDGYFARKYKMVSKFGDYYDHISDVTKMLLIFLVMMYKNKNLFLCYLPILDESESINFLKCFCNDPEKTMVFSKYVSCGTLIVAFSVLIALYDS
jgi:phosphatidylglycerophosphate synthase